MKLVLGFLFIFLFGCTDATTQVSRLFNFNGPNLDQSNLTISSIADVEISGSCLTKFNRFEISFNNSSFESISRYLSSTKTQNSDCSSGVFSLWINPNLFTIQNGTIQFYLRQVSDKDYTESSKITINYQPPQASAAPSALINSIPSETNQDLSLAVSGTSDLTRYRYKISNSPIDCSSSSGYQEQSISLPISFNKASFSDGTIQLCLIGGNSSSFQNYSDAHTYSWTLDTTPPADITFSSLPNSYDNRLSYTVNLASSGATHFYGKISNTDSCSSLTNYSEISATYSFDVGAYLNETIWLCAYSEDQLGNRSSIQKTSWEEDTIAPQNVSFSNLPNTIDNKSSYTVSLASSGSSHIYGKISSSNNCSTLIGYSEVGSSFSFSMTSTPDSILWLCAYSVDAAGNVSLAQSYQWTQDTTAPSAPTLDLNGITLVSYNNHTPSVSISLPTQTAPQSALVSIEAKITNSSSQIISDWTSYSLSSSLTISSLSLIDGNYSLSIRAVDGAGNKGVAAVVSWRVDTTGPVISSKQVVSQPYSLQNSPTFKVNFSDLSSIDTATARIIDESGIEVKSSISITSGVNFTFSGNLGLIKNKNYSVEIFLKDSLGNIRTDGISFTSPNCITTNPNNPSLIAGICDETITDIKGFSMMGGVVLGTDPHDSSYILVVEGLNITSAIGNLFGAQTWGSTSLTSENYEGSLTGATQTPPAFIKYDENPQMSLEVSGAMKTCADRSSNGLSDWFVPSIYQLTKFLCHSNYSSGANASNPSIDPNCATYGKSTTFTTLSASSFGSYSESSSTKYYSISPSILSILSAKSKTSTSDFFCMRRFKKQYP